jgi:mono/diheme cytochrome c family protein
MGKHGIWLGAAVGLAISGAAAAADGQWRLAQMGPGMGGMRPGMGPGMGMGRGMGMGMMHGPGHKGNPVRHRVVMMGAGVPAPYAAMTNPVAIDATSVAAGRQIYLEQCSTCHGLKGEGDGVAGASLEPKPANLAFVMDKPIATDGFLMWATSDGGAPLNTAMPAFKDILSEQQRWQVIGYLRAGLGR